MTPLRFALLGDPVAHSKSPVMHSAAFRALHLPHRYDAIRCREDELGGYVDALRRGELAGLNVTVPHKRAILRHADLIDDRARLAGAANTLALRSGKVVASNTDIGAITQELRRLAPELHGGHAIVLGGGGAARSAIVACCSDLRMARIDVRVRAPSAEHAADLVRVAGAAKLTLSSLTPNAEYERDTFVIVQATSAGMTGADPGEPIAAAVAWSSLPPRAIALDVVYAPPDTPFTIAAREHGIRVSSGLGMLAWQGALALELWLGIPAPFDAMLSALLPTR
ncbi:shikimate dehydrogenase [soil metagenome]